jgi:hypothetical protein
VSGHKGFTLTKYLTTGRRLQLFTANVATVSLSVAELAEPGNLKAIRKKHTEQIYRSNTEEFTNAHDIDR